MVQVLVIVTDNAANNDKMMLSLGRKCCTELPLSFDAKKSHIPCFAHVLHLVAAAMLRTLKSKVSICSSGEVVYTEELCYAESEGDKPGELSDDDAAQATAFAWVSASVFCNVHRREHKVTFRYHFTLSKLRTLIVCIRRSPQLQDCFKSQLPQC